MKHLFEVEQKPLLSILTSMQPICTKRTALETTGTILFHLEHKELILKSTDLEISLQASCPIENNTVPGSVTFLVAGKRIFELVKELDGLISCSLEHNQLTLRSGNVSLFLHIKDAQEFPPFPERIENLMHFDATFLLDMLEKVAFLIPQHNANQALNGLLLEISAHAMSMTTTDGHCLAQVKTNNYHLTHDCQWLLPRRAIFEVKKILENSSEKTIFLGTSGQQLVFSGDTFNFFTKILTDTFPQYNSILNKEGFNGAAIDRQHLIKALRRSICMLSGQFIATQFGFSPASLDIQMYNKEVGTLHEKVDIEKFEGETLDIRFYAPYLLNGLQAVQDSKITLHLKSPSRPVIFESNSNSIHFTYLVMPVSPSLNS
ncbi:hypothetical protein J120_03750 [candidate division TM6 bacterium JCVI TM6SC1]|jgi:DNA polymerase-3 subunit beta|uniref:Beta sliding clamp n=1 Tax=candidate division TM6 bacterium JCVI TM6SC1 TaxID=1306947 RepID=A0A0D2K428_9BACT|nr:hypothetical protein J120_03750 [candidate division TM6 bacterium JCVI TM6SC1]